MGHGSSLRLQGASSLLALGLALWASDAEASVAGDTDGATWRQSAVTLSADRSMDEIDPELASLVRAKATWSAAPAAVPEFVVTRGRAGPLGYTPGGPNQNSVRFAPDGEPLAHGALAITVVTFDAASGSIVDADVVVNGIHRFGDATLEAPGQGVFDLQQVLTHELGHALGLGDDEQHPESAMYPALQPGDPSRRLLSASDEEALARLYAGADAWSDSASGCSTSGAGGAGGWLVFTGALTAAMLVGRRRRGQIVGAGLALAVAVPAQGSSGDADVQTLRVDALVTGSSAAFEGGIIVSELELDCRPEATCPAGVRVLGGQVGELVQVVGHASAPAAGDRVSLTLVRNDHPSWTVIALRRVPVGEADQ